MPRVVMATFIGRSDTVDSHTAFCDRKLRVHWYRLRFHASLSEAICMVCIPASGLIVNMQPVNDPQQHMRAVSLSSRAQHAGPKG